jgi:hypothetical protein
MKTHGTLQVALTEADISKNGSSYPEIMGSLLICISKMAVSSSQNFLQRFLKEIFTTDVGISNLDQGEVYTIM